MAKKKSNTASSFKKGSLTTIVKQKSGQKSRAASQQTLMETAQAMKAVQLTPNGGSTVVLCMSPEKIKFGGQGKFISLQTISLGDVKVPRGSALEEVSWPGTFPGSRRKNEPYVMQAFWRSPENYIRLIRSWRDKGTKVNVLVPGTGINLDCYVQKFEGKYTGGHGDFEYDISFVRAREINVTAYKITSGGKLKAVSLTASTRSQSKKMKKQTSKSKPKTIKYVVQYGDSLWSIAQKYLGSGAKYTKIYNANKKLIKNIQKLSPGTTLTIPTG